MKLLLKLSVIQLLKRLAPLPFGYVQIRNSQSAVLYDALFHSSQVWKIIDGVKLYQMLLNSHINLLSRVYVFGGHL